MVIFAIAPSIRTVTIARSRAVGAPVAVRRSEASVIADLRRMLAGLWWRQSYVTRGSVEPHRVPEDGNASQLGMVHVDDHVVGPDSVSYTHLRAHETPEH